MVTNCMKPHRHVLLLNQKAKWTQMPGLNSNYNACQQLTCCFPNSQLSLLDTLPESGKAAVLPKNICYTPSKKHPK